MTYLPARIDPANRAAADRVNPSHPGWTARDFHLDDHVRAKLHASVPAETRRKYEAWMRRAGVWCEQHDGRSLMPMTAETLTSWIADLVDVRLPGGRGYAVPTLQQAVAAVVAFHKAAGQPVPSTYAANVLIKASGDGREPRRSKILLPEEWAQVVAQPECDPVTLRGARNRFLIVIGFNAWTRRSELSGSQLHHYPVDVTPDGQAVVRWLLPMSKTNKSGKPEIIDLPATGDELCPVFAVRELRARFAEKGITQGPALRRIDRWGRIEPRPLSGHSVNELAKELVAAAGYGGIDGYGRTFTAHGLRASGYTAAKRTGEVPQEALRRHGRWSPASGVPERVYDRAHDPVADSPMTAVAAARRARAAAAAARAVAAADEQPLLDDVENEHP